MNLDGPYVIRHLSEEETCKDNTGNQKPLIEGQTIQYPNEKGQKDKKDYQRSAKYYT